MWQISLKLQWELFLVQRSAKKNSTASRVDLAPTRAFRNRVGSRFTHPRHRLRHNRCNRNAIWREWMTQTTIHTNHLRTCHRYRPQKSTRYGTLFLQSIMMYYSSFGFLLGQILHTLPGIHLEKDMCVPFGHTVAMCLFLKFDVPQIS